MPIQARRLEGQWIQFAVTAFALFGVISPATNATNVNHRNAIRNHFAVEARVVTLTNAASVVLGVAADRTNAIDAGAVISTTHATLVSSQATLLPFAVLVREDRGFGVTALTCLISGIVSRSPELHTSSTEIWNKPCSALFET